MHEHYFSHLLSVLDKQVWKYKNKFKTEEIYNL